MAPEHLEAFAGQPRTVDGRGDVYALGVILFELLAGSHPFVIPRGRLDEVLSRMLDERRGPPPDLRRRNPAVSPAAAAIVRRCLEPDPDRRYRTARELQEDLERHLRHLPLRHTPEPSLRERARKWLRRHPRLASSGGVAAVASAALLVLVLLLAARGQRLARLEAAESAEQFRRELRSIQFDLLNTRPYETAALDAALERCRRLLERHHVLDNPRWQERTGLCALAPEARQRLVREVGELLLLWSRIAAVRADRSGPGAERDELLQTALRLNERAESCYPADQVPRGVWRQRTEVLRLLGRAEEARVLRERAASGPLAGTRDLALRASEYALQGRGREALPLFLQAVREDPTDFWTWFDLGLCYEGLAQDAEAAACFSTCIALAPEFTPLYYKRGLAHLRRNDHEQARADFDRILRDQPEMTEALINRALALIGLREYRLALTDLTRALEQGTPPTRVYFLRAWVRELLGDRDGAQRDRVEGLARRPTDEASWVVRGSARMADDPAGALADFDEALALNPRSLTALQNRAHVLAERLGQTDAALKTLDRLLEFYPDFVPALAGRGILRARQGRREEALRDAQACLARDSRPEILYQVAGIYALTSRLEPDDRWEALEHLGLALRKGYGLDLIDRDRDLDPIRPLPEFRRLIEKARAASARSGTT
jgi:tetratricopeptide (TPR) repeat protein